MQHKDHNAQTLAQDLAWFARFLQARANFGQKSTEVSPEFLLSNTAPRPATLEAPYHQVLHQLWEHHPPELSAGARSLRFLAERVILLLALTPHVRPQALDIFFHQNQFGRGFTEFGGVHSSTRHKGFLPTGETVMYLLAGDNLALRWEWQQLLQPQHYFYRANILRVETVEPHEPALSGQLLISPEYLLRLTTNEVYQPHFRSDFPATPLHTLLEWDDLILDYHTQQEVEEVRLWIRHYQTLMQDTSLRTELHGYRCMFYGESGTGKTLTAALLGKTSLMPVYRIDLSKIVSKYIGETEKNLRNIFEMAQYRDWILFFDEGDALFGKRSETSSSNDRYANQETAYLLQQIEEHPGVIILATNIRANLDKAFIRRFQSEVYFGMPDEATRLRLWQKAFEGNIALEDTIQLPEIARRYELTGAAIKNIKRYCVMMMLERGDRCIAYEDFRVGLRRQLGKEGKSL